METPIALQAQGLSKAFGRRLVLDDVSFEIAQGQIVALTGANGAGKTTLLRCLASLLRPNAGEVRWFGMRPASDVSNLRLIGLVSHASCLYSHLTVRENLLFAARMYDVKAPQAQVDRLLRTIGLLAHADRLPDQISRGMRQRLTVVRALIHDPRIVLLDEPFSSLDGQGTSWLTSLLIRLRDQQCTVCFATHDVRTIGSLADRVLQMEAGQLREIDGRVCEGVTESRRLTPAA